MGARDFTYVTAVNRDTKTGDTGWQNYLDFTWTPLANTNYLIFVKAFVDYNFDGAQQHTRLFHDTDAITLWEAVGRPNTSNDRWPVAGILTFNPGASGIERTMSLEHKTSSSTRTSGIDEALIAALKLDADDKTAESLSESSTSSTSMQDKVTLAWTPASSRSYTIIASGLIKSTATGGKAEIQLHDGATAYAPHAGIITESTADYRPFFAIVTASLSGAQSWKIQFRTNDAAQTTTVKNCVIVALDHTAFDGAWSAEQRTLSAAGSTSYASGLQLAQTLPTAGNYLILASAMMNASNASNDGFVRLLQDSSLVTTDLVARTGNASRWLTFGDMLVSNLSAAAHDWDIEYKTGNAATEIKIDECSIAVFQLDAAAVAQPSLRARISVADTHYTATAMLGDTGTEAALILFDQANNLVSIELSDGTTASVATSGTFNAQSGDLFLGVLLDDGSPVSDSETGYIHRPRTFSSLPTMEEQQQLWEDVADDLVPVTTPVTTQVTAGQSVNIDLAGMVKDPSSRGVSIHTPTVTSGPGAFALNGTVLTISATGQSGVILGTVSVTNNWPRPRTATIAIQASIVSSGGAMLWTGPKSGRARYAGAWSRISDIQNLRGKPIDMTQFFFPQGGFNRWGQFAADHMRNTTSAHTAMTVDGCPALNVAFRPFCGGLASGDTNWATRVLSSWPPKGTISTNAWISPFVPVGYSSSITNTTTQKDQYIDVWQHAADGHFDHLWANGLREWRQAYLVNFGLQSRRLVMRPAWEPQGAWSYGSLHPYSHNISGVRSFAEVAIIKAALARLVSVIRTELPGCYVHFCPLKGGSLPSGFKMPDFTDPLVWDILGPDYYDTDSSSNIRPASASDANARSLYEQRWTVTYNQVGSGGGLLGLRSWMEYIRNTARAINPNVRMGLGEWGIWAFSGSGSVSNGGGDDFVFIERMHEFFKNNADIMAYEIYFNQSPYHHLAPSGSPHPFASAAYTATFGSS